MRTAKQIRSKRSPRKFKRSKARVLVEIIEELAEAYGDEIPITLVMDKAVSAGIDEPEKMLKRLREEIAIVNTSRTTIAKTWPSIID
jgi:hypothetical protein